MRALIVLLAAGLACGPAAAADAPVLLKALSDELGRSMARLDMDGLGKPHYLAYGVVDSETLYLDAMFGAPRVAQRQKQRRLRIDLRVGDSGFDNYNYIGGDYWRYRPYERDLTAEDDYDALRFGAWSATDDAYKYALQKLSEKQAYKQARLIEDESPDLSAEAPASADLGPVAMEALDQPLWEKQVRELSQIFKLYPKIQSSQAIADFTLARRTFLDSEGRRVQTPDGDSAVLLIAYTQAKDGLPLYDERIIAAGSPGRLPPFSRLRAEAESLARDMSALVDAPILGDYVGPVLLEGQAAAEFFNQLLARNVSSPRAPWFENEDRKKDFVGGGLASRLGLRVAAPILSAVDDPLLEEADGVPLFGHYRVDHEGVAAQRVSLVEKGILKDLLMSRAPIKERTHSNGHGRGGFQEIVSGRVGNFVVSAEDPVPAAELKKNLLKRAADFGLDYGILIRRIATEDKKEAEEPLAEPILVYKVYVKDGREELVRGAEFSGVTLRALRDIVGASKERYVYNYYEQGPFLGARGEVQASLVCPAVLLSELELKKTKKKPQKLPYLPPPSFSKNP